MRTDAAVQCGAVDAEQFGGLADIAGGEFQCGGDILAFLFAQVSIQAETALKQLLLYRFRGWWHLVSARRFPSGRIRPAIASC